MLLHFKCHDCGFVDIVLKENAKEWHCPRCELKGNTMNEENKVYRLEQMLLAIERLNNKCEDNMRRLNDMMLELKGIVAMVRPMAKKNDWYKDEIPTKNDYDSTKNRFLRERNNTTLTIELNNPQ